MRWVGDMRNVYKILDGKSEGKIPLRSRHTLEDNIRMDLRKTVGSYGLDSPGSG
jgi:hypothetical protein